MDEFLALNEQDLERLIERARQQLALVEADRIARLRRSIEMLARSEGFDLQDVFPGLGKNVQKTKGVAKYRDPETSSLVWDGIGKPPEWFLARVRNGWTKQRLLVTFQEDQATAAAARASAPPSPKRTANTNANTAGLFRTIALVAGKAEEGKPDRRHLPKMVRRKRRKSRRYMP